MRWTLLVRILFLGWCALAFDADTARVHRSGALGGCGPVAP